MTTAMFAASNVITDEQFEEARTLIGEPLRIEQYNHEASLDTIRHYAHGIGDDNPLWGDEEYAATGRFGTIVAPPTFFYSIWSPGVAPLFGGLQPIHLSSAWTWRRLARRNERIVAEARLVDVEDVRGGKVPRLAVEVGETVYTVAGTSEEIARVTTRVARVPRSNEEGGLKYDPVPTRQYTAKELADIERDVLSEVRRGPEPRFWEDVREGEELTPVVKGPLDRIAMVCYYAGSIGSSAYKASELRWKQRHHAIHHPERIPNSYDRSFYAEYMLPCLGHHDEAAAQVIGMPGAYDNGPCRIGWMAHLVTNWMGDHGTLRTLEVRLRRPNLLGNTTWCRGRVTRRSRDADGEHLVGIEIQGVDQDGVVNTKGSATVALPSRSDAESVRVP
jgi:acyl dehydratase